MKKLFLLAGLTLLSVACQNPFAKSSSTNQRSYHYESQIRDLKKNIAQLQLTCDELATALESRNFNSSNDNAANAGKVQQLEGRVNELVRKVNNNSSMITKVSATEQENFKRLQAQFTKAINQLQNRQDAVLTQVQPATTTATRSYVVKSGDTLSAIARAAGTTVSTLKKLNNLSSDRLSIGQKLLIP